MNLSGRVSFGLLFALAAAVVSSVQCVSQAHLRANSPFSVPVFVYWGPRPETLSVVTHVTPQVWCEGDAGAKEQYGPYPLNFWERRGVTAMTWKGGYCYKDRTEDELVDYWCGARTLGYRAIAIDEFGSGEFSADAKMAAALVRLKQNAPDLFVAVWHSGPLAPVLLDAYKRGADLVMIERYLGAGQAFDGKFAKDVRELGRAKILSKSVFALGINDDDTPEDLAKWGRWANDAKTLKAQLHWIRRHAPAMPGIALYASHARKETIDNAQRLFTEQFVRSQGGSRSTTFR